LIEFSTNFRNRYNFYITGLFHETIQRCFRIRTSVCWNEKRQQTMGEQLANINRENYKTVLNIQELFLF